MIDAGLQGVEFIAVNTDAQDLKLNKAKTKIQLELTLPVGLGESKQDVGQASADESLNEIVNILQGVNMCFITAGMGGGTGTCCSCNCKSCKRIKYINCWRSHFAILI